MALADAGALPTDAPVEHTGALGGYAFNIALSRRMLAIGTPA
jgi:hypothetical protein